MVGGQAEARRRLEEALGPKWTWAEGHPLASLQGKAIAGLRLAVFLGPASAVGSRYFQLWLLDEDGRPSVQAVALGLFNAGRFPAYNWVELVRYLPRARFDGREVRLGERGREERLFRLLSSLVPPGGSLMVEYDSPEHALTARILSRGYPPPCTPLGYALLAAGCLSFRDWYIPEGGREGPRKLQGFKPLDDETARQRARALAEAIREALSRPARGGRAEETRTAARLGRRALALLGRRFP
ncbi:hypothetical protein HRbin24_00951 [bacterium HR24]|jgi:hypothetical protein|nr:hypothetical protein HRbin24_00951 [bacterium HR24]